MKCYQNIVGLVVLCLNDPGKGEGGDDGDSMEALPGRILILSSGRCFSEVAPLRYGTLQL